MPKPQSASQLLAVIGVALAVLFAFVNPGLFWSRNEVSKTQLTGADICTIKRVSKLSCETFVKEYMGKQPVVIRNADTASYNGENFAEISQMESLLSSYSSLFAKVSTANAHTGREWLETNLGDFLKNWLKPQTMGNSRGNETFYLFGSQFGEEWEAFLSHYRAPVYPSESIRAQLRTDETTIVSLNQKDVASLYCQNTEKVERTLSFGIGGENTGVPFHFHGPGFLEMIHGRKQFLLYPPNHRIPLFDPNVTSFHWVINSLSRLDGRNKPLRCTLEPGEQLS
mmetsp:Transcript_13875/g.16830  ORF Transcript_13875/g.16830 Transcript_13875/m.16830 type:complete len:283 (+) Transcript_13875:124-972(+)